MKSSTAKLIRSFTILILTSVLTVCFARPLRTESAALAAGSSPPTGPAATPQPYTNHRSAAALAWADAQLKIMSVDEKVGQLVTIGVDPRFLNQDSEVYQELRRQVQDNHVGGFVVYHSAVYEAVHLVDRMQQLARYPLLISADMEEGAGMRFDDTVALPTNMAVGATGDVGLAERQGEMIGREALAVGVRQIYAPVADTNNNPENPIINVRSYGENPQDVAAYTSAFIKGAQSAGVIATVKHFPGHGDTSTDSHRNLPILPITAAQLESRELIPFKAAVDAGVGSVMIAHIGLPRIDPTVVTANRGPKTNTPAGEYDTTLPASVSPKIITGILRDELRYDGLVVTDAIDMGALSLYMDQGDIAVRAIAAGADMVIKPKDPDATVKGLREAALDGRLPQARLEDSVRRILAIKYDLGLVQNRITSLDEIDRRLSGSTIRAFAQEVARRAVTLVRNDVDAVPIRGLGPSSRVFSLAVTNGDDALYVAQHFNATLKNTALAGSRASLDSMVLDSRSVPEDGKLAVQLAQKADVTIVTMYLRVRDGDGRSISMPQTAAEVLKALIGGGTRIVGISFGNPYLLEQFPQLKTYIVAYGDMPSLQTATIKAMFGQASFTGRLPITLPGLYPRGSGILIESD